MPTTVLLADDNALVRKTIMFVLQAAPDLQIVGQAATYAETLELASSLFPQVIVLDVHMPDEHCFTRAKIKSGLRGSRCSRCLSGRMTTRCHSPRLSVRTMCGIRVNWALN
jgi:DNA-binding NarL/FixJ family response regulator